MIAAPHHPREADRLALLRSLGILDSPPEGDFDGLVAVAAHLAGTPLALVSLIDEHRQWFKAHHGIDASETPREYAFCAHAILDDDRPLVVPDSTRDERFHDNPLVTGPARVVFYAGVPLRVGPDRLPLGTLCVIGHEPRGIEPHVVEHLRSLARQVELQLELRLRQRQLEDAVVEVDRRRQQAEDDARAKMAFLAAMSHEIRTPLHGILANADLLAEAALPGNLGDNIAHIRQAGSGLVSLVNDILDHARLESGRVELERVPLSVFAELELAIEPLRPLAQTKGIILGSSCPGGWVLGDPLRLRQILINLVGNALKFTEKGSVTVHAERGTDDTWTIRISDTGVGMDAATVARLFKPFVQADAGTARRFGGSGLGLSIAKGLLDAMGGTIAVESRPGRGTTFTITLSLPSTANPGPAISEAAPQRRGGLRVLVAEDNPVNQRIAGLLLTRLGCISDLVDDGTAALAQITAADAAGTPYDVVLLDRQMPGLDGCEVAAAIRRLPGPVGRTKLIACTAGAFASDRNEAMDAGMDGFLTKPFTLKELATALG